MGLLDDELLKAAFGVFPQMKPRRRFQDPVGAANVPLDVTRGRFAGLLGLLPDALNFMGRSPMPTEMFGETQYEPTPQMPYGSEYYLQNLPLKPTSRIGEVAGQAGAFVPLNPMPAARAVAAGARALGPTAVGMGERYLQRQGLMPGVVEGRKEIIGEMSPTDDTYLQYLQKALLQNLRERSVGLSQFESTTPARIQNKTRTGGYSVNLPTGQMPSDGLMMGRYSNTDPRNVVIPSGKNLTQEDIINFAKTNQNALNTPENYFGTWRDGPNGATYLDTSKRFDPTEIRKATKFGEKTNQLAGYDVKAGQQFPVGNWEQFINSPEFIGPSGRLAQMETAGRDYLSNFPTGNWWDIRGSNMENVYGKANLPQVAGFTASTAPVSAPRENIQTMSEYMRRHIKGEPILQPEWRVPPGMMTRNEGVQIGMEESRANNLVRSGLGDYANLSGKKVGEEGRALMGDPNAVVLDRHQIRVSEDPSRGIYASGTADIITPGQYDALKNSIVTYTKNHSSKNANEASADIWTGIRETIKKNSDLFGTKFQGSAVTGDSKSYIDHFNDLIKDKANHLGISIKEMEARLKSGDANLMSTLLATPFGLAVWDSFQQEQAQGN